MAVPKAKFQNALLLQQPICRSNVSSMMNTRCAEESEDATVVVLLIVPLCTLDDKQTAW